ncbi:unnamed protein product, partial [Ectocarpus sp. 13 AM-2016]
FTVAAYAYSEGLVWACWACWAELCATWFWVPRTAGGTSYHTCPKSSSALAAPLAAPTPPTSCPQRLCRKHWLCRSAPTSRRRSDARRLRRWAAGSWPWEYSCHHTHQTLPPSCSATRSCSAPGSVSPTPPPW